MSDNKELLKDIFSGNNKALLLQSLENLKMSVDSLNNEEISSILVQCDQRFGFKFTKYEVIDIIDGLSKKIQKVNII